MSDQVDRQVLDLFTVIDNLMKKNNQLTEQNNALQQRMLSVLGAILEKPTILQAPQLTQLTIEQQSISIPENIDLAPQFFIDSDEKRAYVLVQTMFTSGWHDMAPRVTYDSGDWKIGEAIPFGLLRLLNFKYVGFAMTDPVSLKPENVRASFIKNRTSVYSFFVLPEISDRQFPDRSDTNYNIKPTDTIREIVSNESYSLYVRIYHEKQWGIYTEIADEVLSNYINAIKKLVST